jgi:hypothetical protein
MPLILGANSLTGGYGVDNSCRFNAPSSDYLNRTPATTTDRKTWTFSTWFKRGNLGVRLVFLSGTDVGSPEGLNINTSDQFEYDHDIAGTDYTLTSDMLFRDVSAWYHIVVTKDTTQATETDRLKVYVNGNQITLNEVALGYPPQNYDGAINKNVSHTIGNLSIADTHYFDGYMSETYLIDGQALTPTDFGEFDADSGVWKPIAYTGTYGTNGFFLEFTNSTPLTQDASWTDTLSAFTTTNGDVIGSTTAAAIKSTATFTGDFEWTFTIDYAFNGGSDNYFMGLYEISEDGTFNSATGAGGGMSSMTDSWYMSTGGAATKFYYGGSLQSSTGVLTAGDEIRMSRTSGTITIYKNNTSLYQFTPTSTNEIRFVVSNLGSSYIIDLSDSRWRSPTTEPNLGTDYSGNENNFTVNNLTIIDQTTDTPTNNFATLNALDNYYAQATFSNGNLTMVTPVTEYGYVRSSIGVSSGKWYAECKITTASATDHSNGVAFAPATSTSQSVGINDKSYGYFGSGLVKFNNSSVGGTYASLSAGDIIGIALDLDNNKLYFSKNGVFQNSGDPTSGATGTGAVSITAPSSTTDGFYYFASSDNANLAGGTYQFDWDFGNPPFTITTGNADANGYGNFEYTVPAGYYALNTKNLAEFG